MLINLYLIRDNRAKVCKEPWPARNHEEAYRTVHGSAFPPSGPTAFAQYPDDFTLYFLGKFNTETGSLSGEALDIADDGDRLIRPQALLTVRQVIEMFNDEHRERTQPATKKKGK